MQCTTNNVEVIKDHSNYLTLISLLQCTQSAVILLGLHCRVHRGRCNQIKFYFENLHVFTQAFDEPILPIMLLICAHDYDSMTQ